MDSRCRKTPHMANSEGFWSYVHADDEAEDGRILRLARDVAGQFEMLTGEPLTLFLDKDAIKWGRYGATRSTQLSRRSRFSYQ